MKKKIISIVSGVCLCGILIAVTVIGATSLDNNKAANTIVSPSVSPSSLPKSTVAPTATLKPTIDVTTEPTITATTELINKTPDEKDTSTTSTVYKFSDFYNGAEITTMYIQSGDSGEYVIITDKKIIQEFLDLFTNVTCTPSVIDAVGWSWRVWLENADTEVFSIVTCGSGYDIDSALGLSGPYTVNGFSDKKYEAFSEKYFNQYPKKDPAQ